MYTCRDYNAFNVYRRELAPRTVSLTGDRAQGDDSKHWAYYSFLSISSILLPTRKSGIRRDKYLSAAIFKEAVHSDDS